MIIPQLVLMEVPLQEFDANEILIEEGAPGTSVYVLNEGEVCVSIDGKEINRITEEGAILGEMSALLGKSRGATVSTVQPSSLYVIEDLLTFLRQNPELAILLLKSMAQRVDGVNNQLMAKKWWQFW